MYIVQYTSPLEVKQVNILVLKRLRGGYTKIRPTIYIHAVLGFPGPKWKPTFVLLMKGRPVKRRGLPSHKEGPPSSQGGATTPKKEKI